MIQKKPQFTIMADDNKSSAQFSLKQENLAHVFDILRNNLYSDKILAVIREYSTNAVDANVENNKGNIPIDVTLPSIINPSFKVRDYGTGLSEEDIFEIYSSYGASTKRNSNEFVGTLGMGSKSAFGYADSFTVTSYHGGYKKVYEAYIDESKIGTIAKIFEEPSNEPTGICVTIAVSPKDIKAFQDKALTFYTWFQPMPRFFGADITYEIESFFSSVKMLHKSDTCTLYHKTYNNSQAGVKMGNIVYPIHDKSALDLNWLSYWDSLIINVEIGDVSFTTSRESLEMKPATINFLNDKIKIIKDEIASQYQSKIDACDSMWDAICFYHQLSDLPKNILHKNLVWNGKKVNTSFLKILEWKEFNTYSKQWRQTTYVNPTNSFSFAFIIDDGGYPVSQQRARLMEARSMLLNENKYGKILFGKGNKEQAAMFLASEETKGIKIIKLSSILKYSVPKVKANRNNKVNVFKWNGGTHHPYSSCWDAVTVNTDAQKVYVEIESYKPINEAFSIKYQGGLKAIKDNLSYAGFNIEIYGVKKNAVLDSTWIELGEFLKLTANQIVSDKNWADNYKHNLLENKMYCINSFTSNVFKGLYENHVNDIQCPIVTKIVKIKSKNNANLKSQAENYHNKMRIVNSVGVTCVESLNKEVEEMTAKIIAEVQYIAEKYPLLLDYSSTYTINKDKAQQHVNYINAMYQMNLKSKSNNLKTCAI